MVENESMTSIPEKWAQTVKNLNFKFMIDDKFNNSSF